MQNEPKVKLVKETREVVVEKEITSVHLKLTLSETILITALIGKVSLDGNTAIKLYNALDKELRTLYISAYSFTENFEIQDNLIECKSRILNLIKEFENK